MPGAADRSRREREFYPAFAQDMIDVFGRESVRAQHRIATSSLLRIDFHLGHAARSVCDQGIGIEFTMPASDTELTLALTRIDHLQAHYTHRLIVVLISDLMDDTQKGRFMDEIARQAVAVIPK